MPWPRLFFPHGIATLLGAGKAGVINEMAADYVRAVSLGTPSLILFLVLIPVLQIEGRRRLVHVGSLVMAVTDIVFDILNITVLKWGTFGIGMATSISYTMGLLVLLVYSFDKNRIFHIRLRNISRISGEQ